MKLISIAHTGFTVSDIERSIAFYEALGLVCTFRVRRAEKFIGDVVGMPGAELKIAYMGHPDRESPFLELLEYVKPLATGKATATNVPGNGHICFEVSDMDLSMFTEFIGHAVIPDGRNRGMRVAYVRDPDGFTVELMERPRKITLVVGA